MPYAPLIANFPPTVTSYVTGNYRLPPLSHGCLGDLDTQGFHLPVALGPLPAEPALTLRKWSMYLLLFRR